VNRLASDIFKNACTFLWLTVYTEYTPLDTGHMHMHVVVLSIDRFLKTYSCMKII